jgi:hypothetical protein
MQFLDASGPRFVTAFIEKVIAEFPQPDRFVYESSKVLQAIVSQRSYYVPVLMSHPTDN